MEVKLDQNESPLMRHFRFQVSSGLKVNSMDNYSNGIPASDWIWELSSCLVLLSALTLSKNTSDGKCCVNKQRLPPNVTYGTINSKEQAANQQSSTTTSSSNASSQATGSNSASNGGMKQQSSGSGSGGDDHEDRQSSKKVPADKVGDPDSDQQKEQQQQQKETHSSVANAQASVSPSSNRVIEYHYSKTAQSQPEGMQQPTKGQPPLTMPLGEDVIRQRRLARFEQTSPTGSSQDQKTSPTHSSQETTPHKPKLTSRSEAASVTATSKSTRSLPKKHPESQPQKVSLRDSKAPPATSVATERNGPLNASVSAKSKVSVCSDTLLSESTSSAKPMTDEESEKEIDEEELMVKILSQLLDYRLVVSDTEHCRPTSGTVFISSCSIPKQDIVEQKLQEIFLSCLHQEQDPILYCLLCYDRAKCKAVEPKAVKSVVDVAKCLLEVSVQVALEQLVEMAEVSVDDDLWSLLMPERQTKGPISTFISRIGGCPSDGVPVPVDFLTAFVDLAVQSQPGRKALMELICTATSNIKMVSRLDDLLLEAGDSFAAVECLLSKPVVLQSVGEVLEGEVKDAGEKGVFFETNSILSNILGTSPLMVDPLANPMSKTADCFLKLRNFPQASVADTNAMQGHVRRGLEKCQAVVHATLHKLLKTPKKDSVIAWMAAVVSLNEARDAPHFRGKKREKTYANNSVMVNFCNVMLKFCQPFFSTCRSPKLAKINHLYYTLPSCRLDMHNEPCMAMGCLQALDGRQKDYRRFLVENSSNFLTECFFLTQRALHVGLMTTITHFERTIGDMLKAREAEIAIPGQSWDNRILLHVVSWGTSLFDPRFVQLCSEFYITQSAWLMMKMEECKKPGMSETEVMTEQQRVFAHIPEYCVKDMAQWFRFLVRHRSDVLQSLPIDIGVFVTCCVTLLQRPDLLPSALSQSRIVRMLLSFVDNSSRDKRGTGLLGPSGWGSGAFDLSSVVHTCPSVQESLGPALLHTYAAVDVIEGLDVDKEEFDKYGSRFEITCLIENLWRRQDCKASILAESSTEKFKSFLSAILDTLLYQMNDSLARLANVKQVQQAQEDEKAWKSLSYGERERKLKFLRGEESVAQSFMKMAISTLGLLDLVSQSDEVCQCFSTPPLSIRAAAAITNFLDALCGSRSIDLKVKDMSKYNFDPKKLLLTITTVMLRLAKQSPAEAPYVSPSYQDFVQAMADHPDYSHSTMNKASSILRRLGSDEHYAEFIKLVDRVNSILSIINKSEGTATAAALDTSWQDEVEAVDIGIEDLKIVYSAALEDSKYDSYSLQECHAFESHLAVQSLDPRSLKLRALMREATQLSDHLPIHQESSIFVRQDEDRMDIIRALITGPVGTPYSLGCFVFDIYFPTNYPSVPPLVKLITTGNGTVRFNPNLYADGKVCLSLLGTWHGGDATEKWDPNKSNVLQVLLSIQGMILIPDPMYNEPGYEGMRDTPEGNERSAQYNAGIRLSTVRYAMVDQLRKPVEGFDDIIKVHFSLVRDAVLLQCSKWLRECKSPEQERRLRKAVDDLRRELDKL